jgi:hypothetical protein
MAGLRAEVLRSLQPRAMGSSGIGTGRALAELKAGAYERSRAAAWGIISAQVGPVGTGGRVQLRRVRKTMLFRQKQCP